MSKMREQFSLCLSVLTRAASTSNDIQWLVTYELECGVTDALHLSVAVVQEVEQVGRGLGLVPHVLAALSVQGELVEHVDNLQHSAVTPQGSRLVIYEIGV